MMTWEVYVHERIDLNHRVTLQASLLQSMNIIMFTQLTQLWHNYHITFEFVIRLVWLARLSHSPAWRGGGGGEEREGTV